MKTRTIYKERKPPQNIEAEQALLGGILLDNQAIDAVIGLVGPDDFYRGTHRMIYTLMVDMHKNRTTIDCLTLEDALKKINWLEEVGGVAYLSTLTDLVPTTANAEHYARIIRDKSIARKLINASKEILKSGFGDSKDLTEYLERAETLIYSVADRQPMDMPIKEKIKNIFAAIEDCVKDKRNETERLIDEVIEAVNKGRKK